MKAMLLSILLVTACTRTSTPAAPPGTATSAAQHTTPTATAPTPYAPPSGGLVPVNVTLSGSRPMAEVARDLEQRGLVVEQRLEPANIVTGHAPPDALDALRHVSGVSAVERDLVFQIPRPGQPQ